MSLVRLYTIEVFEGEAWVPALPFTLRSVEAVLDHLSILEADGREYRVASDLY